jgi:NAD(P)-dependent dehydrogenase (short-subunit alcohol dehydrogenase family)
VIMLVSQHNDIIVDDALALHSFGSKLNVAIVGATGGLGRAFVEALIPFPTVLNIFCLSRSNIQIDNNKTAWYHLDLEDEDSIIAAAASIHQSVGDLHLVIVATGMLHDGDRLQPEKSWRDIDGSAIESVFRLNTIGPALIAKHFLPLLAHKQKSVFTALSARIGSIEDNHLGGWHSYRASKAALHMLLKNFAIELARRNPQAICIGIHPGTVDTGLSKPFQANVQNNKLFSPKFSAHRLLNVIDGVSAGDSGAILAWDGKTIPY